MTVERASVWLLFLGAKKIKNIEKSYWQAVENMVYFKNRFSKRLSLLLICLNPEKKCKKGIDKEGKEWYTRKAADWAGLGHWKLNNNKIRQEVYEKELLSNPKRTRKREKEIRMNLRNDKLWRVWSWLRINAGGVHNTFKSNGERQLRLRQSVADGWVTRE